MEILSQITGLVNAGTTSKYLAKHVAKRLCVSEYDAYAERHANRQVWHETGRDIRREDPGILLREALAVGPLTGGIRDLEEVKAARELGCFVVWIENPRVPPDPTIKFDLFDCDFALENKGTISDYRSQLTRLAIACGLLRG